MSFFKKIINKSKEKRIKHTLDAIASPELQEKAFTFYELLQMQKELFTRNGKIPERAESPQGIGYVFGFSHRACGELGLTEKDSAKVMFIIIAAAFDADHKGADYLQLGAKATNERSGEIYEGIKLGYYELHNFIENREDLPPMGWLSIATGS